MGNSQKKPEGAFDLSPSMLMQTSVEDKIWLNVPEENLFNDTFTNEKYYMLNTNPDVEETSSTNDQQFNEVAESKLKLDDMLYFGMVDEQRVEQAIVSSLVEQLATSSVRSEYFETVLKKRLYIIKRIYLALNRERARDQVWKNIFKIFLNSSISTGYQKHTKYIHVLTTSIAEQCSATQLINYLLKFPKIKTGSAFPILIEK